MRLITFGCSWTFGCGVDEKDTFRSLLTERLGFLENINHAIKGSSNQKQERLATEFFTRDNIQKGDVVLWGITSTARDEVYLNTKGDYYNFLFNQPIRVKHGLDALEYSDQFYNQKNQLQRLAHMMNHWNMFFESHGIKNMWFNTFNTYILPQRVDRFMVRDLLTQLTHPELYDEHDSVYKVDGKRISEAKSNGMLNKTLHPTEDTHAKIADILETQLRDII